MFSSVATDFGSWTIRVDPILEGLCHPGEVTGSHKSCFPCLKMVENYKRRSHTHSSFSVNILYLNPIAPRKAKTT